MTLTEMMGFGSPGYTVEFSAEKEMYTLNKPNDSLEITTTSLDTSKNLNLIIEWVNNERII